VAESGGLPQKASKRSPAAWEADRLCSLLKTGIEEIKRTHPQFFGTFGMEVNFREGEIETVALTRRQTLK
jgi:hypothetical protein